MATPSLQESTFIIQKIILHTVNQSSSCPTLKTSTFSSFSGFRYSLAVTTIFPTPKVSMTARFRGSTCPLPAAAATTILPTPKTSTPARFWGSAALCLPPPPPPSSQRRKQARLLVFGVLRPLPAATAATILPTPKASTTARFRGSACLLPPPPSNPTLCLPLPPLPPKRARMLVLGFSACHHLPTPNALDS